MENINDISNLDNLGTRIKELDRKVTKCIHDLTMGNDMPDENPQQQDERR